MKRSYYISDGQSQDGPFALYELKEKDISSSTLIWHEGLENWKSAKEIIEVRGIIKDKPKPPPIPIQSSSIPLTSPPSAISELSYEKRGSRLWKVLIYAAIIGIIIYGSCLWYLDAIYYPNIEAEFEIEEQFRLEEEEQQAEERRKYIRNNFENFLNLSNSSYTYYKIGGIQDLYIQVDNTSEYRFDQVIITVAYIKENGGVYKYENIDFGKLKAKGSKKLKAPNSSRGTSVQYYIAYASSERLNFEYSHNESSSKGDDPYKMR
jgi:hypothetical protein